MFDEINDNVYKKRQKKSSALQWRKPPEMQRHDQLAVMVKKAEWSEKLLLMFLLMQQCTPYLEEEIFSEWVLDHHNNFRPIFANGGLPRVDATYTVAKET